MNTTLLIIIMAVFSLLAGLFLYVWLIFRSNHRRFHTTLLISWLLIALFPVMLIFSFFPESSASGNLFGFSLAGAIAAFVFIWWRGTYSSLKADKLDTLEEKIRDLEKELQERPQEKRIPAVLQHSDTYLYWLKAKRSKQVGLIAGRIEVLRKADAWVSSENTNMQMSRFYERSVSGVIRYYGAKKDIVGNVVEDVIANELARIRGDNFYVHPATVLITGSGELQNTHNVKKIFHVASVQGEVGEGYRPIKNIELCVTNVLTKADSEELKSLNIKSIVFPLMGAGTAQGNLKEIAQKLIQAAILYLETTEGSTLERVYFLTWTDVELETCREILQQSEKLVR